MQLFIHLKGYFNILGIKPNQKNLFDTVNVFALIIFTYCCAAMIAFLIYEPDKSFFDIGNAFFGVVCLLLNSSTLVSNIIKNEKIFKLIEGFEEIIEERLDRNAFNYNEVNEKIEKWSNITHTAFIKVTYPIMYIPKLVLSYYSYYFIGRGSDSFILNISMSSPFYWRTPLGYLAPFSIQFVTWFLLLINCTTILSFLSGVCWILTSFEEDIAENVLNLKNLQNNRMELKKKIFDIIKFDSIAKQFVKDFSDIYETVITGYYLWSILTISSTLLVIRIEITHNGNIVDILFASIMIFWAFIQMFVFCDLGENMSNRFGQFGDMIYECDWYAFPYEIQHILPTVLIMTQEPVILQGFMNLKCTRESFKKVVQGGFSYFMTLQQFTH